MAALVLPSGRAGQLAITVGALAGAWAGPALAHLVSLDALLIPAIVVATAALVRSGRTLLDQLVVAVAALFGGLCVAGLAASWWPFGLHPVPLAGSALSGLVLLASATRRRPALRLKLRPADWTVLAAAAAVAALTLRQFVQRDAVGRLALLAPGEDLARHFVLFDAIGQLGGYPFLRPEEVARISPWDHAHYPQGWHLSSVVLDHFWRSSDAPLTGPAALDWFVWTTVATFGFFAVAVLWAARRLAGPFLTGGRSIAVLGAIAGYLFFGDPVTLLLRGFPNELAGLAMVAVAVAVLARPLRRDREQLLLVAALGVAVSFTYYLFLPVLAVGVAGWLLTARRRLRRHPVVLGVAVLLGSAAVLPVATNPVANRGEQVLLPGTAIPVDRQALLALPLLIVAGLFAAGWAGRRSGLRLGPWRIWAATTLAALALAAAIVGYQYVKHGAGVPYYGEKAFHLVVVLFAVGFGAVAGLLPRFSVADRSPARLVRVAIPTTALTLTALTAFGGLAGPPSSSAGGSYGMGLLRGREGVRGDGPAVAYWASKRYPGGDGRITVDLSHGPWANYYGTLYGLAMQRTYVAGVSWYVFLYPDGEPKTIEDLEQQLAKTGPPVRFVVGSPNARFLVKNSSRAPAAKPAGAEAEDAGDPEALTNVQAARQLAERYPGRVEIVQYPG